MSTLFTDAERKAMRLELRHPSKVTHTFNDSVDFRNRERFGTNANGTKYRKA
jgi:hypothetical protein